MQGTEPGPVWNMLMNDTGTAYSKIYGLVGEMRSLAINNDDRDRATDGERGAIKMLCLSRGSGHSLQLRGSEDMS